MKDHKYNPNTICNCSEKCYKTECMFANARICAVFVFI